MPGRSHFGAVELPEQWPVTALVTVAADIRQLATTTLPGSLLAGSWLLQGH